MFAGILGRRILMNSKKLMIMIVAFAVIASALATAHSESDDSVADGNVASVTIDGETKYYDTLEKAWYSVAPKEG